MKGKIFTVVAGVVLVAMSQSAFAAYSSIQHNLIDGDADTYWNSGTGEFTIQANNSNNLVLNDPLDLGGTVSNAVVDVLTNFSTWDPIEQRAKFVGGNFSLTFDYDYLGSGPVSYEISGPVAGMEFWVSYTSSAYSTISGEGLWTATTVDLPGSDDWPAVGFSSIGILTLGFGVDLTGWQFGMDIPTEDIQSLYTLLPNDSAAPEPTTMVLLAAGLVGLTARRRRRA